MSTALAKINAPATWSYLGPDMESAGKLAKALVATGLAPQGMTAGQAFYIMLAGAELGLCGPIEALRHVQVIKGKPAISAELMRAMMLEQGCEIEWARCDSKGATIRITRPGGKPQEFTFDEADAKRAHLLGKGGYETFPTAMYMARATSLGARAACPDMLRGASYTPEELGARTTVTSDGDIEYQDAPDVTPEDEPEPNGNGNGGAKSPALPEDPARNALASTAQVKALAILATRKLGGIPREDRLTMYGTILGRAIETSSDLTQGEWRRLVEALNGMSDKTKGEGPPASEAKASGAGEAIPAEPASERDPHGLWDGEKPAEPEWKRLNPEQSAVRNSIVKLAKSVDWIDVETKRVLAPRSLRECFTVDPGEWVEPEKLATRPNPKHILAMYQEEVEAALKEKATA